MLMLKYIFVTRYKKHIFAGHVKRSIKTPLRNKVEVLKALCVKMVFNESEIWSGNIHDKCQKLNVDEKMVDEIIDGIVLDYFEVYVEPTIIFKYPNEY